MNPRFLQLHFLTSYGPANLNRDDLGIPKTAMLGGAKRLRVSSQALKRAWRNSELFAQRLHGDVGIRSKRFFLDYYERHAEPQGVTARDFAEWVNPFKATFGDFDKKGEGSESRSLNKDKKALLLSTLVYLSPRERSALESVLEKLVAEGRAATADEVSTFAAVTGAADISMFGRMLASLPEHNVEAAVQIAHAITVHRAEPEDDYFSAVDDLNETDTGSAHLGELGFGAGVFYLYACVDRDLLVKNLGGDSELAGRAIQALVECMATVAPTGKQKSFASNAAASYGLAELSNAQPRQLSAAFVRPIALEQDEAAAGVLSQAIGKIEQLVQGFDAIYGWQGQRFGFNVDVPGVCALASTPAEQLAGDTLVAKLAAFAASDRS